MQEVYAYNRLKNHQREGKHSTVFKVCGVQLHFCIGNHHSHTNANTALYRQLKVCLLVILFYSPAPLVFLFIFALASDCLVCVCHSVESDAKNILSRESQVLTRKAKPNNSFICLLFAQILKRIFKKVKESCVMSCKLRAPALQDDEKFALMKVCLLPQRLIGVWNFWAIDIAKHSIHWPPTEFFLFCCARFHLFLE